MKRRSGGQQARPVLCQQRRLQSPSCTSVLRSSRTLASPSLFIWPCFAAFPVLVPVFLSSASSPQHPSSLHFSFASQIQWIIPHTILRRHSRFSYNSADSCDRHLRPSSRLALTKSRIAHSASTDPQRHPSQLTGTSRRVRKPSTSANDAARAVVRVPLQPQPSNKTTMISYIYIRGGRKPQVPHLIRKHSLIRSM